MRTALLAKLNLPANALAKDRLIEFAINRVAEVNAEMTNWREKLTLYELQADNQFEHRRAAPAEKGRTIFDFSNKSLNMVRGVARYMRGRCAGDIAGGAPWFYAKAEGLDDAELAEGMQKHLDFKLRQADYRKALKDAIGTAIDLGTCVQKTTWRVTAEPYDRLATVLVDQTGEPVLKPTGDYIEADDDSLTIGDDNQSASYQPDPSDTSGEPAAPIPGKLQERLITEANVKYRGLCVDQVSHKNLLVPMDVERLDDADLVGHFYDRQLFDLKADYDPQGTDPDLAPIWDLLSTGQESHRTGEREAKRGEVLACDKADERNPWCKIHELRLRFAPFDDGQVYRIYLVIHVESRSVLHADYLGNITPAGDLDMHPVVVNRVPSRWYGRGYFEVYEMLQNMIDGKLNAIIHRNNTNADPIKVLDCSKTEETLVDGKLTLGPDRILTKRQGTDPQGKVLEFIALPDLDQRTWELLQLFMQILQQDSGVTAAAQGDPGALPSVSTATGTNAILSSGSTMHQLVIDELREGLEPGLTYAMRLLYARQDRDETFSYMKGSQSVQALLALANAKQLRQLYLEVSLTLTRIKNQEMRQSAVAAIPQAIQYYTLPPNVQMAVRPLVLQVLKGLEIDGADEIITIPQMPPPMAPGAPVPGPAGQPGAPEQGALPPAPAQPAAVVPPAPGPAGPAIPNILNTGAVTAPQSPMPVNVIPTLVQPASN